jgi:hypothetical protein
MSNSINWTGNKVLDPGVSRQAAPPTAMPLTTGTGAGQSDMTSAQMRRLMGMPMNPTGEMSDPVGQQGGMAATQQGGMSEMSGSNPSAGMQPSTGMQQGPPPATEKGYIPYYLASNIGKSVRAEFIIGANQYTDRTGVLTEVGINYFVLHDVNSRTNVICDLYSVKFVTVLLI